MARLTEQQVAEIRWRFLYTGLSQKQLADKYGVSTTAVSSVVNHHTYADVPPLEKRPAFWSDLEGLDELRQQHAAMAEMLADVIGLSGGILAAELDVATIDPTAVRLAQTYLRLLHVTPEEAIEVYNDLEDEDIARWPDQSEFD